MKKVTLYTTKWCPYCNRALKKLQEKGVEYTNINVAENSEKFEEIKNQTGWNTVPQIFIGEAFIGGCDDLMALEEKNALDDLLK